MDRASDSDSESQGFDSLHAYNEIFKNFTLQLGVALVSTFNNEKKMMQVEVCTLRKNLQINY